MRRAASISAAVVAVALTACGSSSGHTSGAPAASAATTTVPRLTKTAFVDRVDRLCAANTNATDAIIGPLFSSGPPSATAAQDALDQIVALNRKLDRDIRALAGPVEMQDDMTTLLDALKTATDTAAAQTGAAFFASQSDPWKQATELAKRIGFTACSGGENG